MVGVVDRDVLPLPVAPSCPEEGRIFTALKAGAAPRDVSRDFNKSMKVAGRSAWLYLVIVALNFLALGHRPPPAQSGPVRHVDISVESRQRISNTVVTKFLSAMQRDGVALAPSAVEATLEIYNIVLKELLPTPAKSHYTFNMRDVSPVFRGVCQCTRESLPKGDDLAKVWYHECERVFRDRLVTKQGHGWLFSKLKSNMNKHFKKEFDQLCKGAGPAILTDFVDAKSTAYLEVVDHVRLGERVGGCLENCNSVSKIRMDLALSQTEISKGYGMDEWHDDMKRLLMRCGCDDMGVLFLLGCAFGTSMVKRQF